MKNFYESNIALNGYEIAGKEFISKRTDGVIYRAIDENLEEAESCFVKQSDTRAYAVCFSAFCFAAIALLLLAVVVLSVKGAWSQAWYWAPIAFFVPLFGAGVTLLLVKRRMDELNGNEEYLRLKERYEFLENEALDQLGVPRSAIPMDVLAYFYEHTEEGERVSVDGNALYPLEVLVYREGDALHLADDAKVVTVPFDRIADVENVERKTYLARWNKPIMPTDRSFKTLGLRTKGRRIWVDAVSVFTVKGREENFELIFPCYETPYLLSLWAEQIAANSAVGVKSDTCKEKTGSDKKNDDGSEEESV